MNTIHPRVKRLAASVDTRVSCDEKVSGGASFVNLSPRRLSLCIYFFVSFQHVLYGDCCVLALAGKNAARQPASDCVCGGMAWHGVHHWCGIQTAFFLAALQLGRIRNQAPQLYYPLQREAEQEAHQLKNKTCTSRDYAGLNFAMSTI